MKPKTKTYSLRFDEESAAKLAADASALGLSRSDYLRTLIRESSVVATDDGARACVPVFVRGEVISLLREIRKQGTNLNQAAHALNVLAKLARNGEARYTEWSSLCAVAERDIESAAQSLREIESCARDALALSHDDPNREGER